MKELLKNKWAWAVLVLVVLNISTIVFVWCSMCCKAEKRACHRREMYHHDRYENSASGCHHGCGMHAHGDGETHNHDDKTHGDHEHCAESHKKSCCSMPVDSTK